MNVASLVSWPNAILEKPAAYVEDFDEAELAELRDTLHATMTAHNGLGLAAVQIGIGLRAFVLRGFPDLFLNTEIVSPSEETAVAVEGCLSLPGLRVPVERPVQVKLKWRDITGAERARKMRGMDARACQHEHDHTKGFLITDRAEAL